MLRDLLHSVVLVLLLGLLVPCENSTSLCLSCATTTNGYCVSCNTNGCAPYSTLASSGTSP